ncbi:hypothetical protein NDI76_11005 [Halogeometricum sp. S1BR25-6]|uniref:DUF3784 domain-containing protein n=1 Tax=Halogeometricum salsisoli TaxID=2950536 RepID=A0ABU2GEN9_9EURY|nr:hypothetical protein [Halogeometricum sp. S1BR25-6]MDS0299268.1 hypothetical protein [Halogeometricum sp. S1BR25-6]
MTLPIQSILGDAAFFVPFAVFGLGALGLAFYLSRLEHEKEMALIEAGEYRQLRTDGRAWILGGLLLGALGLADVTTTFLAGGVPQEGVAAAFVGLAALAYYFYKRREDRVDAPESATRA